MSDIYMRILLSAQDSASQVIKSLGSAISGSGGPGGALLAVGVAATLASISFGVASTKMAADYQQSMNRVQALTGSSTQQMGQYDTSLKNLAINAGVAPKALADGLYNVLSAGYKGADAMNVLTLATEDAKIGMTSATVTSDALTNVMASFAVKASDATRVNGEMLETVTLGKATFEQYAQSIVKSASSASQFHVSMETMNAAWSTMTSSGIRAAQASTDFQQSLKVMYGNIGTVTKSLNSNGIAFDETKFNAMSYGDKVEYLNGALQQANDKHVKVTGVTLQAAQAISTISQHIGAYNSNLATLSNNQAMAQKTQQAWSITQSGFNQQMSRLSASVQVLMIDIGQQLLPIITQLVSHVTPLIVAFTSWIMSGKAAGQTMGVVHSVLATMMPTLQAIGSFLVSTFAPVWKQVVQIYQSQLVPAFNQFLSALRPIMPQLQTFGKVILGVVVVALVLLVGILAGVVTGLANMLPGIVKVFTGIVQYVSGAIQVISGIIAFFVDLCTGKFAKLGGDLGTIWGGIVTMFKGVWNIISGVFSAAVGLVGGIVVGFVSTITNIFTGLYNNLVGHSIIPDMINAMVSWFEQLPGRAGAAIQGFISTAIGLFNGFANSCFNVGANIVNGVANGITSAIGSVTSAISSVTSAIAAFLPHSPAKRGALMKLNEFGAALVNHFANDISSNSPKAHAAAQQMVNGVAAALKAYPKEIARASLAGNTAQVKSLEAQRKQYELIMKDYKDLLTIHGDRYSAATQSIIFGGATGAKRGTGSSASGISALEKAIPWFENALNRIITLLQGQPLTLAGGGSSGSGGAISSRSGGGAYTGGSLHFIPEPVARHVIIVHNHTYNINTMARSQTEVKKLVDMIDQEQGKRVRTTTSGYNAGGVF